MTMHYQNARAVAQMLISGEAAGGALITREVIASKVNTALACDPLWAAEIKPERLIADLETTFSVWIGVSRTLEDNTDHVPWLPTRRADIPWRYWQRYRMLLQKRWPIQSIERLDEVTDDVLMRLEDPKRTGAWDRRGLVVGHVQSGKTASYTGLICKAADAGYKVIIVLAGIHKSLRSQTQVRLDEGFLGYDSTDALSSNSGIRAIGVGTIDPGPKTDTITTRSDDGDFKKSVSKNFHINPGGHPLLFVVKKNASVLKNLVEWVARFADRTVTETGVKVIADVPLLVIDDEADHASVDTRAQAFDEDGKPDPDHDPTIINQRIRKLLHCFQKSAYVGYTATPFANIFIHERGKTQEHGEDLFPRSFITNLPAPSDYVGPVKVFGLDADADAEFEEKPGLPLVRHIEDHAASLNPDERSGWMPPVHNKAHKPLFEGEKQVASSLREAIHCFALACAARRARMQVAEHNSMLIHVTRFTNVQNEIYLQVKAEVAALRNRLELGEGSAPQPVLAELQRLWEEDFIPTTQAIADPSLAALPWSDVEPHLLKAIAAIQVRQINGSAGDVLDYETHRSTGLSVIAVGGDKLARGLTLEGLTVSYFLRASKMYDTLMQMGRWFGYRPGYMDLCRLYMPEDLEEWFQHVTAASEELRQEFDRMAAVGGTPRDYGLKVQAHPVLMVTSRVKMRSGTTLQVSFAGAISETTVFHRDAEVLEANWRTTGVFLERLGTPVKGPAQDRPEPKKKETWRETYLWTGVKAEAVASYLEGMKTHPHARKVNGKLMAEYIQQQAAGGELTEWVVALVGREGDTHERLAGLDIGLIKREPKDKDLKPRYVIPRLLNPRDEAIDLGLKEYQDALLQTQKAWTKDPGRSKREEPPEIASGPYIRQVRPKSRGLLLLYPLDPKTAGSPTAPGWPNGIPTVAFAVSFPASDTATTVAYKVNNVYYEQEYGEVI